MTTYQRTELYLNLMWIRLKVFLFGGMVVRLTDYDGEINYAIARQDKEGKWWTYRFPHRCAVVYLKCDGTVSGAGFRINWQYV